MTHLLLTVRWLDSRYHGLIERDGPPEWPPSPFRLFQALVSGIARCDGLDSELGRSLAWLQGLKPPLIIGPPALPGTVVTHFVPNNDGDKKPSRQERLKGKTFQPTVLIGKPEIHYIWAIKPEAFAQALFICKAARCLTCLGWGIDAAYSDGRLIEDDQVGTLLGVRWYPGNGPSKNGCLLRVPIVDSETGQNTLTDLRSAYQSALDRVGHSRPLNLVAKSRVFGRVSYENENIRTDRPLGIFRVTGSPNEPGLKKGQGVPN